MKTLKLALVLMAIVCAALLCIACDDTAETTKEPADPAVTTTNAETTAETTVATTTEPLPTEVVPRFISI